MLAGAWAKLLIYFYISGIESKNLSCDPGEGRREKMEDMKWSSGV